MRPVALGRRNWIHVGSPQAGPKVAAILSIVETCRRLRLQVRDYLAALLPGLASASVRRFAPWTAGQRHRKSVRYPQTWEYVEYGNWNHCLPSSCYWIPAASRLRLKVWRIYTAVSGPE
jgi:hypothetical protein